MKQRPSVRENPVRTSAKDMVRNLAWFRYNLRKFLRFSEKAARQCGVTPQQHQLMLGVAGYTGRDWATISELAEFLQEQHNSVVGLVERAVKCGLVRKKQDTDDRRFVSVYLTPRGADTLAKLTEMHQREVQLAQETLLKDPQFPSQILDFKKHTT
jgi:DNA-binding MarR family transcriptional regulator